MILDFNRDAQGHEIYDYFNGNKEVLEIVERNDGFVEAYPGPHVYLSKYEDWAPHQKAAIRAVRGRVLDIGCGFSTPWFDYLLASKKEMKQLVTRTGWTVRKFIESSGPPYIAIVQRE